MTALPIDLNTWPRRSHFEFYTQLEYPFVGLTTEVDITALKALASEKKIGFFAAMVFYLLKAHREVPSFRQRIRPIETGLSVVEHTEVHAGYTVPVEGGLFNYAVSEQVDDIVAFARNIASQSAKMHKETTLDASDNVRDDLVFLSCLPWRHFTQVTQPMASKIDSVPRIAWGKYQERDGQWFCPVNIQAHHALVDGFHIAQFLTNFELLLSAI